MSGAEPTFQQQRREIADSGDPNWVRLQRRARITFQEARSLMAASRQARCPAWRADRPGQVDTGDDVARCSLDVHASGEHVWELVEWEGEGL